MGRGVSPPNPLQPPTAPHIAAIIPCWNEAETIGPVIPAVLAHGVHQVIVVVDARSTDATAAVAAAAGAKVVIEARPGYGQAIQSGIAALPPETGIVLFLDGDGSDPPERIPDVLAPILAGRCDFVLGTRLFGEREQGALSPQQILAGRLAGVLLRLTYGARFTDMSPYRAIRRDALAGLGMRETSFGWNLEMQMRVAHAGLRATEVPVGQRRRAGGVSKVSGNLRASVVAGWKIGTTFLRLASGLRRAGGALKARGVGG